MWFSDTEQNLFAVPTRLGDLEFGDPVSYLFQFDKVTNLLVHLYKAISVNLSSS